MFFFMFLLNNVKFLTNLNLKKHVNKMLETELLVKPELPSQKTSLSGAYLGG